MYLQVKKVNNNNKDNNNNNKNKPKRQKTTKVQVFNLLRLLGSECFELDSTKVDMGLFGGI